MSEKESAKTPSWAIEPFNAFMDYHKRMHDFYHFSIAGFNIAIYGFARTEELKEQLRALKEKDHIPLSAEDLEPPDESAKRRAESAKSEAEQGFPILHESQTILLWSSLEWLVEGFLASLLSHKPELLKLEPIQRIKISLAEYGTLEGDEKYRYIVSELERDSKAPFKFGVDRFEVILDFFSMSGAINATTRKDLVELANVRNILVHRRGIADPRLVRSCPWIGLRAGEKVSVTEKNLERYYGAVFDYVETLLGRVKGAAL